MPRLLIIATVIALMATIVSVGEPAMQTLTGAGAQAQHNRCVQDQACYRKCRNEMRKPTAACCRLCRGGPARRAARR
jgi:hypothetical protein